MESFRRVFGYAFAVVCASIIPRCRQGEVHRHHLLPSHLRFLLFLSGNYCLWQVWSMPWATIVPQLCDAIRRDAGVIATAH
ncbi:hypothetical protein F5141DRAFT_210351 [Pisolithus sp. B1]|nr:hypothetical protein F5141DRAFT_210351 [Pisolithus sp. B1]